MFHQFHSADSNTSAGGNKNQLKRTLTHSDSNLNEAKATKLFSYLKQKAAANKSKVALSIYEDVKDKRK